MTDIAVLLARARQHEPDAVAQLIELVEAVAAQPNRTVAEAFGLRRGRRGGDPRAARRARRDAALRALAKLTLEGGSAERQARLIADRVARYRPLPAETGMPRRLMRQVVDAGLQLPGPDRIARILRSGEQKTDWIPENPS